LDEAPRAPERTDPGRDSLELQIPPLDVPKADGLKGNEPTPAIRNQTELPVEPTAELVQLASHTSAETTVTQSIDRIWLSGEVVLNESGGPRLLVDVAALAESGQPMPFAGEVSLMVLAPTPSGPPRNLARWDFTPSEAASAAGGQGGHPNTMRFYLELPTGTIAKGPVELWARLINEHGKLLSNAGLDLQRASSFASTPFTPPREVAVEAPVVMPTVPVVTQVVEQVQYERVDLSTAQANATDGWTIAKPGEPVQQAAASTKPAGAWRASSEPIPIIVAESAAARPAAKAPVPAPTPPVVKPVATSAPEWAPDRLSGEKPAQLPQHAFSSDGPAPALSAWSPTR
jgi:hypothetical protein